MVLAVPQFSGLRSIIAGTEMLATVPDFAAAALIEGPHLRADDPPFELVNSDLSMDWSRVTDNDPAERWLRSKIIEFMGEPGACAGFNRDRTPGSGDSRTGSSPGRALHAAPS